MTEKNDRIRNAGLRMALKLLPDDLLAAAPAHLERYLNDRLREVEPEQGEAGACYLVAPQGDGSLKIMLATLDEESRVSRVVSTSTINDVFTKILEGIKDL